MVETEEILVSGSTAFGTGTTAFYFATNTVPSVIPDIQNPAYVIFNKYNQPVSYGLYDNGWISQEVHGLYTNVQLTAVTSNFVTGYSFSVIYNNVLNASQQTLTQNSFNNTVVQAMQSSTAYTMNPQTFVFFKTITTNDNYINLHLKSNLKVIDTLKVYNNPINSVLQQNSTTGVVFGKLEAIQPILDVAGDNIRIPLANVPIGIFVTTDQFPQPTSLDNNGDRFYMNLTAASSKDQYFNEISYNSDLSFLRSDSEFTQTPEKFLYTTITNENGEYVLQGVPVGSQTIVFEIDLFKQGLTKDEIALNIFPFPTDQQATLGRLPCYVYNQVPTTVLPSWGDFQTGYTEQNISISLDLRKWATYIFPPVAFGGQLLQQAVAIDPSKSLKIDVRDMTRQGFPLVDLNVCQVPNDLARRVDGINYWYNEFTQQTHSVQFYEFGCNVIKLPANIYDPYGFQTDENGIPTSRKGVWLGAYQFNEYINNSIAFRKTGSIRADDTGNTLNVWSHFDLTYTSKAMQQANLPPQIGVFPYEQPWSAIYPEPYSIPSKPVKQRYLSDSSRMYGGKLPGNYIVEEPKYSDGDLVGSPVPSIGVGGFGTQMFQGVEFSNRIALVATKDYMYKYESGVAWNETYANNFQPFWSTNNQGLYASQNTPLLAGMSSVVNGEKYQRVECGYAYFMRPFGWPRIFSDSGSDRTFDPDITPGTGMNNGDPNNPGPGTTSSGTYLGNFQTNAAYKNDVYNIFGLNLVLSLDTPDIGELNIYRVVSGGTADLTTIKPFVIPTFMQLSCALTDRLADGFFIMNEGITQVSISNPFPSEIFYTTTFGISGATAGQNIYLDPGQYIFITIQGPFAPVPLPQNPFRNFPLIYESILTDYEFFLLGMSWLLPGNNQFNLQTNRYDVASYTIGATGLPPFLMDGPVYQSNNFRINFNVAADFFSNISPNTWWIRTYYHSMIKHGGDDVGNGISTFMDQGVNTLWISDPVHYVFINNLSPFEIPQSQIGYNGPPLGQNIAY